MQGDFNEGDIIKSEVIPPETGENPHEKTRVPNKGWRLPRQEQTQRDWGSDGSAEDTAEVHTQKNSEAESQIQGGIGPHERSIFRNEPGENTETNKHGR